MVTPRYQAVEVSASARPEDVVGAIVDTALENKRREQETWLNRNSFTCTKAGVRRPLFQARAVDRAAAAGSSGP